MKPIIRVRNLSKQYSIGARQAAPANLRETLASAVRAPFRNLRRNGRAADDTFWALKGINFDVAPGEILGIIGRNGAGKSTLLKILSRITEPTTGRVELYGRLGSLLEVGTGFHPELTGRENVYLNSSILGISRREIERKFDEIVDFSEVERFIDTPVKYYSSGMYVRLAFSVAVHLEPEILLMDEVLAVGDLAFQRKCLAKMNDVSRHGRTVLFVSHSMQAIRGLCKKAIWLKDGELCNIGESNAVVEAYLEASRRREDIIEIDKIIAGLPADPVFRLRHVSLEQDGVPTTTVLSGKPVEVVIDFSVLKRTAGFHITVELLDSEETMLVESINNGDAESLPIVEEGDYVCRLTYPAEFLAPRLYEVSIKAGIAHVRECYSQPIRIPFEVQASGKFNQAYPRHVTVAKLAPLLDWKTEFTPLLETSSIA